MSRLTEMTPFGFSDIASPSLRIYYPAELPGGRDAPVLAVAEGAGAYPLVVFLHGQRGVGEGGLCPQDIAHDYQRWGTLLDLPARCGVVVVAVNISDTGFSPDGAAADAVEALAWARTSWPGRDSLREPPVAVDPSRPPPRPRVAAVGHSWERRRRLGWRRRVKSGVWPVSAAPGTTMSQGSTSSTHGSPRCSSPSPRRTSARFPHSPGTSPSARCLSPVIRSRSLGLATGTSVRSVRAMALAPPQTAGSRVIAAEVLVEFLHRYLYNANTLHPSLLTAPLGDRPPIAPHLTGSGVCAVRSRWQDPFSGGDSGETGLGDWPQGVEMWVACRGLEVSSTSILFGQVPVRTTATRIVRIRNTALSATGVKYSAGSSKFRWEAFDGTLAPQEERVLSISYRPTSTEIDRATVTIRTSAFGGPHTVTLMGKGAGGFPFPGTQRESTKPEST